MITTIYKCDRCGDERPTHDQIWSIGISLVSKDSEYRYASTYEGTKPKYLAQDWCRKCVEIYGLLHQHDAKPEEIKQPKATLEDLVRELAREEITAMTGAS